MGARSDGRSAARARCSAAVGAGGATGDCGPSCPPRMSMGGGRSPPWRRSNDVGAEAPARPPAGRNWIMQRNPEMPPRRESGASGVLQIPNWKRGVAVSIGGGRRTSFPEMAIVTASHFTGKRERPTHIDRQCPLKTLARVAGQIVMTTTSYE